jgi:hypothetical protein
MVAEVLAFWRSWGFSRNAVLTCDYVLGVFWLVVVDLTVIAGIGWFAMLFTVSSQLSFAISSLITWLAAVC